ncbi:MAG: RDD family protein [Terriglobia bacterium]
MSDHLIIETPEQISLEFPLAGIGSRFLALSIDTLIQLGAMVVLVALGMYLVFPGVVSSHHTGLWKAAALLLMFFVIEFGYFAFFEAVWNGQTPGKRTINLRVITDSGQPITAYDSVARNLLRIVDSIPGIYAVGIITVLLSSQSRRLGDYVAGTVVVREVPLAKAEASAAWQPAQPAQKDKKDERETPLSGCDISRLSAGKFQLIEAFLARREQLPANLRRSMAREITARVAPELGIPVELQQNADTLLQTLATEYRNRARFR